MKVFKGVRLVGKPATLWVQNGAHCTRLQPAWPLWKWGDGSMDWAGNHGQQFQAATALLLEATLSDRIALGVHYLMVERVFPRLCRSGFEIDEHSVIRWCMHTMAEQLDTAICDSPYKVLSWGACGN